jgi:excisionase family DNA binding protein
MDKLLTTQEVADILGKKPDTVAKWRKQGLGPPFMHIGVSVRYNEKDLKTWLENSSRQKRKA